MMSLPTFKKCSTAMGMLFLTASIANAASYSLNVSTALGTDDPIYKGLVEFKKNVETRSQQQIKVKIFPSSQLGSDEDIIEQIKAGAGTAIIVDGARLAVYTKELGILTAPYIVNNFDEMRSVVTSPLFDGWSNQLREQGGLQIFSFNWYQGERHLVTNKAITQPSDLAGIRMRTPGAPVWIETVRALGATPTPLPWAEAYSALQLKAIDAVEVQYPSLYTSRIYEVTKFVTKTHHIQLITGLVGSKVWFDKLPADLQKIVREESLVAGDFASQLTVESLLNFETEIKQKGMTVNDIDVAPFVKATEVVYSKLGYEDIRKQVAELVNQKK